VFESVTLDLSAQRVGIVFPERAQRGGRHPEIVFERYEVLVCPVQLRPGTS
jgi:hypothetical protein